MSAIIYNVTINVDESIHDEWIKWMKEDHIPKMLNTGKFHKALMSEVLVNEEMGGVTYSIQYTCRSRSVLDQYYNEEAGSMRQEGYQKFGDKFGAFRTELRVVEEFKS